MPKIWLCLLLAASVTWPFFLPGELIAADMVVLNHHLLSPAALGLGGAPRATPQDAFLAVFPWPRLFVPALMYGSAALGALQAWRHFGPLAALFLLWNPFTTERLLQGNWTLVAACWLLPVIITAAARRAALAVMLASLTPTGAIFAFVAALLAPRPGKRRLVLVLLSAAAMLPWAVPALAQLKFVRSLTVAAAAFGPHAEAGVGTFGAALSLGGIWNSFAIPASRQHGFALVGVLLFALACWRLRQGRRTVTSQYGFTRWLVLAAFLFLLYFCSWLAPFWPELLAKIPGLALFRDSHKLLGLVLPAALLAFARQDTRARAGRLGRRLASSWLAAVLMVGAVPDASLALTQLRPVQYEAPSWLEAVGGRQILGLDVPYIIEVNGHPAVNPLTKQTNLLLNQQLKVSGQETEAPSVWFYSLRAMWATNKAGLCATGVSFVLSDGKLHALGSCPTFSPTALQLAPFASWLVLLVVAALAALLPRRLRLPAAPATAGRFPAS